MKSIKKILQESRELDLGLYSVVKTSSGNLEFYSNLGSMKLIFTVSSRESIDLAYNIISQVEDLLHPALGSTKSAEGNFIVGGSKKYGYSIVDLKSKSRVEDLSVNELLEILFMIRGNIKIWDGTAHTPIKTLMRSL